MQHYVEIYPLVIAKRIKFVNLNVSVSRPSKSVVGIKIALSNAPSIIILAFKWKIPASFRPTVSKILKVKMKMMILYDIALVFPSKKLTSSTKNDPGNTTKVDTKTNIKENRIFQA